MAARRDISELHKRFIEEYATNGYNGAQAYLAVRPGIEYRSATGAASTILKRPEAQEYLAEINEKIKSDKIASLDECLEELTNFIRNDTTAPNTKLKAIDMRLKTLGAFIDKKIISNDITINVDIEDDGEY